MSVDTTTSYFSSAGDGVTTTFGFAAPVQAPTDIIVELVDATTGAVTSQLLDTDYTVSIAADGQTASVTLAVAPPAGKNVVRRRNADYQQPYKLPANGPLPNDEIEAAIDRVIMQLQAIRDIGNRGIRLADSDPPSLATLPPLASLLNTYLFINGSGVPVGMSGVADVPVSGAMTPVVEAASLALALTALGFSSYVQTLLNTASKAALQISLGIVVVRSHLAGLGTANNGGTPNSKVDVAAGLCADSTNALMLAYAGGTLDCGTTGANGLDTGTLASSTWYHLFVIGKTDGTTALLASTSVSGPTMPSGYTLKRRIGSFKTDGSSHILSFTQDGDYFRWAASVLDVNDTNPGTTAQTKTMAAVPTGVNVQWFGIVNINVSVTATSIYVSDLAANDEATLANNGVPAAPGAMLINSQGGTTPGAPMQVRTNTSAQLRYRLSASAADVKVGLVTLGWLDRRGRDA